MIEFRNVMAGRPGLPLIKNFNWRIGDGENWLINGSNGAGKTLLLELLAGRVSPMQGEIKTDFITGDTWDERFAQRKQLIHYVPTHAVQSLLKKDQHQYYQQRYYSIGDLQTPRVRDVLGGNGNDLRALNLPPEFSIDSLLPVEVNRLSNGQLRKLLLIRIMMPGIPRLLLLDYPFEGLDQASRVALCDFLDFLIGEHNMQVILTDQHNELPRRITHTLRMERFAMAGQGVVKPDAVFFAYEGATAAAMTADDSEPDGGAGTVVQSAPTDTVVQVRNLKIQYGDHVILKDFNWTVNKGDRWALIGRNGAGKTTLFSMIFADHPMAYSQDVYLFGRRRGTGESIWDIKRRISYLGPEQLSYLSPAHIPMTAHEYLRNAIRTWRASTFTSLVDAFDAGALLTLPVRALSSGQLQVMLIIKCLMTDCELLLLDEPYQFLDPQRKRALNEVLSTYLDPQKTMILITHYAADLAQWTNKVKVLSP